MTGLRTLRLVTAVLLGLSGVAFTVGVGLERSAAGREQATSHRSTATATIPATSPTVTPTSSPSQRSKVSPTRRPTLSAVRPTTQPPEGSPAREAQERAAAAAKAAQPPEGSPKREAQERAAAAAKRRQTPTPRLSAATTATTPVPTSASTAPAEGSPQREAQERAGQTGPATTEASERLFGIDVESTGVIVLADLLTLLLIAMVLLAPAGTLLGVVSMAVVAFGLGAAGLDGREVLHQQREGRTGLVAMAILVALLHLTAASTAAVLAARSRREMSAQKGP